MKCKYRSYSEVAMRWKDEAERQQKRYLLSTQLGW